ncbi:peptidase S41 [Idiomarina seosinensis]|uniref:S41 family peptidase n=1 Tax=Idiomarina seosinensis TaxID=281739 RepID=UPI00384DA5C5
MNTATITCALSAALLVTACGGSSGTSAETDSSQQAGYGTCSVADQNQRFFDYMQEDYFWNEQLPAQIDPENFANLDELLDQLRAPEDRYSYILTDEEYQSLFVTAEYAGFGFSQQQVSNDEIKLRFVYQDSPAWNAGMRRADSLIAVDGVKTSELLANGSYGDALGEAEVGVIRELSWRTPDGREFTETLSKDVVATNSVMGTQVWSLTNQTVGYFTLDSFINRTGADLNQAFDQFQQQNVTDLVIDLRYNSGGLIRYANQAATQAAGINVQGETFIEYRFNEQNSDQNQRVPFSLVDGVEQLDLNGVVLLTTGASCSSSEIIINSLRPHIDVTVIGNATCGKPVGQVPNELCDKVTFAINFETVNSAGEGQYYQGLQPDCPVSDQLVADWGSFNDPLTAAAKHVLENNSCPVAAAAMQLTESSAGVRQTAAPQFYNLKEKRASLQ